MPVIQDQISVAANSLVNNVLDTQGKALRNIPMESVATCTLYLTSSAAGMRSRFAISGREEMEESEVSTQNRIPINEDLIAGGLVALPGEILQLAARNTTGGALTLFYRIDITYSAGA